MVENKSIESLLRAELKTLKPYESHVIPRNIKLDANENPFPWPQGLREELYSIDLELNRYPDGMASELRRAIAGYSGQTEQSILVGNGSDELIQLVLATFGGPGRKLIIHPPTFSMYSAAAKVTGTGVVEIPLTPELQIDTNNILEQAHSEDVNIIIICNPNNPTGTLFPREDILSILKSGKIVIVDEAYVEFSGETLVGEISRYPNLIVMRTFSKAFGMAALRLGYILAQEGTIQFINRVRQPFNVNSFTQKAGVLALKYVKEYQEQIKIIKEETLKIAENLKSIQGLQVFPTWSNFILFKPQNPEQFDQALKQRGFSLRHMGELPVLGQCIRVSAGLPEQNDALLKVIREIS